MGICIYGVKITHFIEDKNTKKYYHFTMDSVKSPYTLDGYERSLLKEEKIDFVDYQDISFDYFMMTYSNFLTFKESLSKRLFRKPLDKIFQICHKLSEDDKYPSPLYHLLYFADTEGYIGPQAVQEMAKELQKPKVKKKFCACEFSRTLYKIILETSKHENGYLRFN